MLIIGASAQPTLASDEYAYWASSNQQLFGFNPTQHDPMLQSPGAAAYASIISMVRRYFYDGVFAMRLLQVLIYVSALLLVAYAARLRGPFGMSWALAIALSSPFAAYVTAVMPETWFIAIAAVAIVLAAQGGGLAAGAIGCALAGLVAGQALFFKPHAIALIVGLGAAAPLLALPAPANRLVRAGLNFGVFVVGVAISVGAGSIIWRASSLIGAGYTGFLPGGADGASGGRNVVQIAKYILADGVTAVVLGGPAILAPASLAIFRRTLAPLNSTAGRIWIASMLALGVSVAMTAVFTTQVGAQSAFEAGRIHARYFAFYATLAGVSALAVLVATRESGDMPALRASAGAYALLFAIFLLWVWPAFKFYPWDAPWLAGFIKPGAKYWPSWQAPIDITLGLAAALVVVVVAAVALPKHMPSAHVAFLVVLHVASGVATLWWVNQLRDDNRVAFQEVRAFSTLASSSTEPNQGVIVLSDRYGGGAHGLWGLAEPERVVVLPQGSPLTEANVPADAAWILMLDRYDVRIPYVHELRGQRVRLLLREGARPRVIDPPTP